MSDRRLKVYCEALEGISLQAVREAYAIVRDSDEFKRLPPPGQFRALAVRAEAAAPSTQTSSEDLEGGRATLEEIDEIFAQFKAAHPNDPFAQALWNIHKELRLQLLRQKGGQKATSLPHNG